MTLYQTDSCFPGKIGNTTLVRSYLTVTTKSKLGVKKITDVYENFSERQQTFFPFPFPTEMLGAVLKHTAQ